MTAASNPWEVIIVGGGPAGLSGALLLGRCRRRVLLIDDEQPRNARSHAAHGVFTRDGEHPEELRRIARAQLERYGVSLRTDTITCIERDAGGGFQLTSRSGGAFAARKVLLATGIVDQLPDIPGMDGIYGRSGFHCPYCDGWEVADRRLAVLARGARGVEYALGVTTWSHDVVLCTHGSRRLGVEDRASLRAHGIALRCEPIQELVHETGRLQQIVFASGERLDRDALFFSAPALQRSHLAKELGCEFTARGAVKTGKLASTGRGGLYVAGDAAREVHFVSVAAAEGLKAAFAINQELRRERSEQLLREPRAVRDSQRDDYNEPRPSG